jgi:(2Fe-2S) ferredoxin
MVCAGTGCVSCGSLNLKDRLESELKARGLSDEVKVVITGCNGFCAEAPIMVVYPEGIFYKKLTPEDIPFLVEEHFLKGRPVEKFLYSGPAIKEKVPLLKDIRDSLREINRNTMVR